MNPHSEFSGVYPDYKWDFTGLISMGVNYTQAPYTGCVHSMVLARQCIFSGNETDISNWVQRLHRFVQFCSKLPDEPATWVSLIRPDDIDHDVLRKIGMDVYQPEYKLLTAYDTESEWLRQMGAWPVNPQLPLDPEMPPQPPGQVDPHQIYKWIPPTAALSATLARRVMRVQDPPPYYPDTYRRMQDNRESLPPRDPLDTEIPGGTEVDRTRWSKAKRGFRRLRRWVTDKKSKRTGEPPKKFK